MGSRTTFGSYHHWFQNMTQTANRLKIGNNWFCTDYKHRNHLCYGPKLVDTYAYEHLLLFLEQYSKNYNTMAFYGADENHECRRRRRRRRLKKKKKKDADVFDGYQGYADYSYSLHSFLQTLLHKHEN